MQMFLRLPPPLLEGVAVSEVRGQRSGGVGSTIQEQVRLCIVWINGTSS